jgi:hypothetical protein
MDHLRTCHHTHNTSNSKHLIPHNTAFSQEWRLQRPIASRDPIRHNTNLWHRVIILSSRIQTVGRPTRILLLVLLATQLTCTRGSLPTTAVICCLHSKSHPRNLQRYRTSKICPSNRRREGSRLRRMLEGRNTTHISNLWRLLQRLVCRRKIHGW